MRLNCLLAFLQFAGYNPLGLYLQGMNYYGANVRYAGEFLRTTGNTDIFSAVLCVFVLAVAGIYAFGGRLGGSLYAASELLAGAFAADGQ